MFDPGYNSAMQQMGFGHAPNCGKCGKAMTPQNAKRRPELFLHDACLPDELKEAYDSVQPAHEVADPQRENLLALLGRIYREVGNESPGFARHAMTPGLRDDIRDCLKASGRLKKHQHEPCADVNCTTCNRRYEAEKQSMDDLAASGGIVDAP